MIIGATVVVLLGAGLPGCRRPAPPVAPPPPSPTTLPAVGEAEEQKLAAIDSEVNAAIEAGDIPGAVVVVGTSRKDVYRRAFGYRAVEPRRIPMTEDTIFDLASLTKVIATATSIMILDQEKRLSIKNAVATYIPEFASNGKEAITLEQLLLHTSGLIPDNSLGDYSGDRAKSTMAICGLVPQSAPGAVFAYSDVGYIVLGEVVERVSGVSLDSFVTGQILRPLVMTDAGFKPADDERPRCAPTEQRDGQWIVGQVHDPRAYRMGGVAGHAGLFATADDLTKYCRMILNGGVLGDRRILSTDAVGEMTRPRVAGRGDCLRGLGWDISSPYSSVRGCGFELGRTFGHTGFTGTSIWIDPDRDCFVILLTSRLHPGGKGAVGHLRSVISTIVADALRPQPGRGGGAEDFVTLHRASAPSPEGSGVTTGIDALVATNFEVLKGRRVGLIANPTSVDRSGRPTIELIRAAPDVHLAAIFSPEHGLAGATETAVADDTHAGTGLKVFSLYGQTMRPTAEMLSGLDTLVFDIQDIGTRYYTYITTMRYAMEAAAGAGLRFVVLDRPNPITGRRMFGPIADEGSGSFTCPHPLPTVHGLTVGELAWMFNRQRNIRVDLHVVAARGWKRSMWFDQTGLAWVNPSPNIRSLTQAILYPGVCLLERTNVSVGRGTGTPFEQFGAPWMNSTDLVQRLNGTGLPGVSFHPVQFVPTTSLFAGQVCSGIALQLTDRQVFDPIRTGLTVVQAIHQVHPDVFQVDHVNDLLVSRDALDRLKKGEGVDEIAARWAAQVSTLHQVFAQYRIYE
jgi:uncharacterized protein YbbC (DUF1343 family)/CubicO group peptidase (beta-lactamase class C family)